MEVWCGGFAILRPLRHPTTRLCFVHGSLVIWGEHSTLPHQNYQHVWQYHCTVACRRVPTKRFTSREGGLQVIRTLPARRRASSVAVTSRLLYQLSCCNSSVAVCLGARAWARALQHGQGCRQHWRQTRCIVALSFGSTAACSGVCQDFHRPQHICV